MNNTTMFVRSLPALAASDFGGSAGVRDLGCCEFKSDSRAINVATADGRIGAPFGTVALAAIDGTAGLPIA